MKPEKWDPKKYVDRFSKLPNSPAKARAYQAAQMFLRRDERKVLREFEVFLSFSRALGLDIAPADVVMLDPNSTHPPPPDVECELQHGSHYFELAEIIQENIAAASSLANERPISTLGNHLAKDWDTLWGTFTKKLGKTYSPEARPRSLLLYYDRNESLWEVLGPFVDEKATEIRNAFLDSGAFEHVFLFDMTRRQILLAFSAESFMVCG